MIHQLSDYELSCKSAQILCDNFSAICLSKTHVHHSWAKNVDIKYYFIRDHKLKGDVEISFINTENQLVDIFTKPLLKEIF